VDAGDTTDSDEYADGGQYGVATAVDDGCDVGTEGWGEGDAGVYT